MVIVGGGLVGVSLVIVLDCVGCDVGLVEVMFVGMLLVVFD